MIILLSSEFFIPLRLLGSYFHIAMNGMAASDRIFALLDTEEEVVKSPKVIPASDQLNIKVENVNFSYDGQRQVLKDISLDLTPGGLTAIVGESGSGKSTMAALLLAQKKELMAFLKDGRLEASNNRAERAIKTVVIGRKNYLFSTSLAGAEANAIIYSVIETAKEHGLNVYKYLTYLFEHLPNVEFLMKPKLLEDFLPWAKNVQEHCKGI